MTAFLAAAPCVVARAASARRIPSASARATAAALSATIATSGRRPNVAPNKAAQATSGLEVSSGVAPRTSGHLDVELGLERLGVLHVVAVDLPAGASGAEVLLRDPAAEH